MMTLAGGVGMTLVPPAAGMQMANTSKPKQGPGNHHNANPSSDSSYTFIKAASEGGNKRMMLDLICHTLHDIIVM
jgi:hypothetical protein